MQYSNTYLIYDHTCICPPNYEECIKRYAELLVVDLWDVLDVNAYIDYGETFIWQVKF